MNIFKLDKELRSYKYPIIKIIICVAIIFVMLLDVFFDQIHISLLDIKIIDIMFRIFATIINLACVLRIYISFGELIYVSKNRAKDKILSDSDIANCEEFTLDDIISLSKNNYLLDIWIVSGNRIVEVGPTAVARYGDSKFYNKHFRIEKEEFWNIDDFKTALIPYLINEKLLVVSINGTAIEKLKRVTLKDGSLGLIRNEYFGIKFTITPPK